MINLLDNIYIHAIGECDKEDTYRKLIFVLDLKALYSCKKLDELGISHNGANKYGLDIPKGKEWMYYDEDIHYEVISMHDPSNRIIRNSINKNVEFGCFRPSKIAFAISKDVKVLSTEEIKGIDIGEVQVKDSISSEYIVGIIIPTRSLIDENIQQLLCDKLKMMCDARGYVLPIYDYQGNILYQPEPKKQL